ncbi:MAG: carbamoyltransferase C-terminal domain-containing protein [Candidatus Omnitrophota bacterium]
MNILGICDSQDAGAVFICDGGKDITAVNEERLSRIKLCGGFPEKSIKEILRIKKIDPQKIDQVVLASKMTPSFLLRSFRNVHARLRGNNKQFSFLLSLYILYQMIARKTIILAKIEEYLSRIYLKARLKKLGIKSKVSVIDHHTAHAYAAYSTSGYEQALIITIDGLGDGLSFTVSIGKQGRVTRIFEQNALNDITLYYSRLTDFLGFKPIQDEGKVMGLAGYSSNYFYLLQAQKLLKVKSGRFRSKNIFSQDKKIYKQLKGKSPQDIAASFQVHVEQVLSEIVDYWVDKTKISDVALGGGFFANIKVNQKIAELKNVNSVYVYPHMGDGGIALGAIFAVMQVKPFRLKNVFWGPSYSQQDIEDVLKKNGVRYERVNNIENRIAELISQGKIVARFCGAMEYGPRALGNRSVLAPATDKDVVMKLNQKLGRDMFMPFAPVVLADKIHECCLNVEKAIYSANFMNVSFSCTEYFKKLCPAVVHTDGTTRPQCVFEENNFKLFKILNKYQKITKIPAMINTSFNTHEEPIVCSPEDALRSFKMAKLEYLAMENFLIKGDY